MRVGKQRFSRSIRSGYQMMMALVGASLGFTATEYKFRLAVWFGLPAIDSLTAKISPETNADRKLLALIETTSMPGFPDRYRTNTSGPFQSFLAVTIVGGGIPFLRDIGQSLRR